MASARVLAPASRAAGGQAFPGARPVLQDTTSMSLPRSTSRAPPRCGTCTAARWRAHSQVGATVARVTRPWVWVVMWGRFGAMNAISDARPRPRAAAPLTPAAHWLPNAAALPARATTAGHGGDVRHVQWHPTSSLLASASKDALVKLWDARAAGEALATLHGHKGAVMQVRRRRLVHLRAAAPLFGGEGVWQAGCRLMLPAGEHQAVGVVPGSACAIRAWFLPTPTASVAPSAQALWNQNGNWLLSVSRDQTLKVRAAAPPRRLCCRCAGMAPWGPCGLVQTPVNRGHVRYSSGLVTQGSNPSQNLVKWRSNLQVWDVRTLKELHTLQGHSRDVLCADWHPVHEQVRRRWAPARTRPASGLLSSNRSRAFHQSALCPRARGRLPPCLRRAYGVCPRKHTGPPSFSSPFMLLHRSASLARLMGRSATGLSARRSRRRPCLARTTAACGGSRTTH